MILECVGCGKRYDPAGPGGGDHMTDEGWMVDDGTCGRCLRGDHYDCLFPRDESGDVNEMFTLCCCDEGYEISYEQIGIDQL